MANGIVYRDFPRVERDLLDELAELGVATVHESMDTDGLLDPELKIVVPRTRVAGQAVTVHNLPGNNLGVHVGLEVAQPGDVIVLIPGSSHPGSGAGLWGGIVSECAHARGIGGVVADGYVRDTSVMVDLGFPVWARGANARGGRKDGIVGVNIPISCGGVLIFPGDVIVADSDGVVAVPRDRVEHVVRKAKQRAAKEEELVMHLRETKVTTFQRNGYGSLVDSGVLRFESGSWEDHRDSM